MTQQPTLKNGHNGCYGHKYDCQQKADQQQKTVYKNMKLVKSYGQNKFVFFVFWPRFDLIFCQFVVGRNKQSQNIKNKISS